MEDRAEMEIVVDAPNSIATSVKRSKRAKPSAKAREALLSNESDNGPETSPSNNLSINPEVLQRIYELVANSRNEVRDLKEIINNQQAIIQQLTAELQNVTQQLEELGNSAALAGSAQTSPQASYAQVARTPPTSQPSNVRTLTSMNTTPSTFTDTLYCTIDTSRMEDEKRASVTAGTVRAAIEKEMRATGEQKDWRCRAVTMDPRKPQRIKIVCRDETEHRLVKQAAEKTSVSGARVLRDELYPIKVDSVRRTAVLDENDNIRDGAAEAFGQENETTVAKVAWLSRKDNGKAYGSMVVYLTKAAEARKFLEEGFFYAGGESGYTRVFERRERPEQCYNCQQVGHKAFQCKNTQTCGRCAKQGHSHQGCEATVLKCVPCGGPHESFSRHCPKLYPSNHD
ncbi:hypothetical protein PG993_011054 [Apiospora rasikravindrae]|uniref:CCHC-type domain-containing protein n=1 Tax=Apiospora rasikravindrae TaxID=990691 RepID=A0ABR1SD93_9PEZI